MPQLARYFDTLVSMLEHNAEETLPSDERRMIRDLAAMMAEPIKRMDEIIADAAEAVGAQPQREPVRPKPELRLIHGGRA